MQICEKCHEREATSAAVLSHGGPNLSFTHLCQQCLEAEQEKGSRSLLDLIDEMEGKSAARREVLSQELKEKYVHPSV
jgi:hypothetical protein